MIRDKSFPTDPQRRWVIARLLQIPPALLGVVTLDDLVPELHQGMKSEEPKILAPFNAYDKNIDLREYHQALKRYSNLNHTNTAMSAWGEIARRIVCLEQALLYGSGGPKQRARLTYLLCKYHMLLVFIACDQEWYDAAISHSTQAYGLTRNEQLPEMQAAVLLQRGWILYDRACSYESIFDFDTAQQYFSLAQHDFLQALEFAGSLSLYPGLQGYLHLSLGVAQTHLASHSSQLHAALREIEKAEKFVGKKNGDEEVLLFVTLDEERYHLDRASAYTNAKVKIAQYPRDTRRELRNAIAVQADPHANRRQAFNTILLARSYLLEREFERAAQETREALQQVKAIHSSVNLARIAAIRQELKMSDYGKNNIEVAALEIEVIKAQHPGLFH